jgi:acetylornithine deacetylase/succinyl-diaminopimelate desuccinylase-like protein
MAAHGNSDTLVAQTKEQFFMHQLRPAFRTTAFTLALFIAAPFIGTASAQLSTSDKQLSKSIFKQLIEINTTESTTAAAEAMAKRLLDAGFPQTDVSVIGPDDQHKNLVVRYRGTGQHKPILLIGHLDTVEARRQDWTTDPFQFVEQAPFVYGRGTQDMKDGDAIYVTNFIRLKRAGYKPDRDIILALTADEEGGNHNGVSWLLKNHRDMIDAAFVLNQDAGGVTTNHGKPVIVEVDASEKLYCDYKLTVTNPGGHSSLPRPDNAIYQLTDGLVKLQHFTFPFQLNAVTRAYFAKESTVVKGQQATDMKAILTNRPDPAAIARLSQDPFQNATMRTTCVATRLLAGEANNALPQRATANVNCRILPGSSREQICQKLVEVLADPKIDVAISGNQSSAYANAQAEPPAPLRPELMQAIDKIAAQMWPGAPVVPSMSTGATDGKYTNAAGMPTYGVSGVAIDVGGDREHARDERVKLNSYYDGVTFYYRLLKALTSQP